MFLEFANRQCIVGLKTTTQTIQDIKLKNLYVCSIDPKRNKTNPLLLFHDHHCKCPHVYCKHKPLDKIKQKIHELGSMSKNIGIQSPFHGPSIHRQDWIQS